MVDTATPEALIEQGERLIGSLKVRSLVMATTAWAPRAAWWQRSVLFSLVLLAGTALGAWLAREPVGLYGLHIWAALLLLTALVAYELLAGQAFRILREAVIPHLPPDAIERAIALSDNQPLLRGQAWVSGGVGALTALLLGPALFALTGVFTPFTDLIVFLGSAFTANLIYIPAMVTALCLVVAVDGGQLYPLDPANSQLVRGIEDIGTRIVWTTVAIATVGVVGPLLIPSLGIVSLVLALLVLTGAVAVTGLQFALQQWVFSYIVSARREQTLNELQAKLSALYARQVSLTEAEQEQAELLLRMHDRAVRAPANLVSLPELINFTAPLLVPLLSLIIGSLNLPFLHQGVIGLLLQVFLK